MIDVAHFVSILCRGSSRLCRLAEDMLQAGGFHSPASYLWLSSHPLAGPLEESLHVVHSYVLRTMSSENVLKV